MAKIGNELKLFLKLAEERTGKQKIQQLKYPDRYLIWKEDDYIPAPYMTRPDPDYIDTFEYGYKYAFDAFWNQIDYLIEEIEER